MKTVLIFLNLTIACSLSAGSGNERVLQRAIELYNGGSYHNALKMYLDIWATDSSNSQVAFRIGACYLKTGLSSKKAEHYLRKSTTNCLGFLRDLGESDRTAPMEAHLLLGDAFHLNYRFTEAINEYETFRVALKAARIHDLALQKAVQKKIEACRHAAELMENPAEVEIVNLGPEINSAYADYAPRLTADQHTMIFTARRPENTGGKTFDEGQFFEDIYISTKNGDKWTVARSIGEPLNTVGNEAAVAISSDGQEIILYKDDMGDGNLYSSRLEGNKWSLPKKLNNNVNTMFWEPCAFISADGNSLYFVSDRPGGFGGTDIYVSRKNASGDWGKAQNLGPIVNTPEDEYSPFLHPDGETLYFSSKGHKGMGGYDVFYTRPLPSDPRTWLAPVNVGYPVNGTGDDAFYMVSPDKQSAYYSSLREGGMGEKDNYMVTFRNTPKATLSLVKGQVSDTAGALPPSMKITITDNATGEVLGVYKPNASTGKYSYILRPGTSYNIAYEAEGHLFYSENRFVSRTTQFSEVEQPVHLAKLDAGATVKLNNLFFDFDSYDLRPASTTELERIYQLLWSHPGMKVEVVGFADSRGSDAYNAKLALQRAKSVTEYLRGKGIEAERLSASSGFSPREVSRARVPAGNAERSDGRQTDRRVELRIISTGNK